MRQVLETIDSVTISDIVQEAVNLCLADGMLPTQAARAVSLDSLDRDDVHALAVVGLARLVSRMIDSYNDYLASETTTLEGSAATTSTPRRPDTFPRATPEERRQVLYLKAKDILNQRYVGADGVMKTLSAFTATDHRFRLTHCDAATHGWRTASRFHHESLVALKAFEADTIGDLPEEEQDRLRGRLR